MQLNNILGKGKLKKIKLFLQFQLKVFFFLFRKDVLHNSHTTFKTISIIIQFKYKKHTTLYDILMNKH